MSYDRKILLYPIMVIWHISKVRSYHLKGMVPHDHGWAPQSEHIFRGGLGIRLHHLLVLIAITRHPALISKMDKFYWPILTPPRELILRGGLGIRLHEY